MADDLIPELMSTDDVAALWGIDPQAVRSTLARYGVRLQRGWPRDAVEAIQRPGRGYRSDLHDTE